MEQLKTNILNVLKYYDYFHYPLNKEEILFNFPQLTDRNSIEAGLNLLISERKVFRIEAFYCLQNDPAIISRRIAGNKRAEKKLVRAYSLARFLSWFPFVSAVFISGSLSKNYADEHSDTDFFICVKPNKLWISRTLLHLFKKLTFAVGAQHNFCMNYFIDCAYLQIEEQNIYTAIELATLKANPEDQDKLRLILARNPWMNNYLPNFYSSLPPERKVSRKTGSLYHLLFNNRIFDGLNFSLMHFTKWVWKNKWRRKGYPMEQYDLAFKTRIYVSKNHPDNYQKKMLDYCLISGINV